MWIVAGSVLGALAFYGFSWFCLKAWDYEHRSRLSQGEDES